MPFISELGTPLSDPGNVELGINDPSIVNASGVCLLNFNIFCKGAYLPRVGLPTSWFYGGVEYPLSAASANSLLQDADPAIFYALDFYQWVLQQYLGARWATACAGANYRGSDTNVITKMTNMAVGYNPVSELVSMQAALPLLALYRVSSTSGYKTVMKSEEQNIWEMVHVLPPMDASQLEVLLSIQHAMYAVIDNRTEWGMDPAYTPPGGQLGQQVWQLARIEEIQCQSARFELYGEVGGMPMPVLIVKFNVKEMQGRYLGFPPFQGAAATIGNFDQVTQTTINDISDVDTWIPVVQTI